MDETGCQPVDFFYVGIVWTPVFCLLSPFLEKYLQISVEKSMYFQSNFLLLSKTRKYDFLPNFDLILW